MFQALDCFEQSHAAKGVCLQQRVVDATNAVKVAQETCWI